MNWYKVAQTLQDVGKEYYSFSFPTKFSDVTDLTTPVTDIVTNSVLKNTGGAITTFRKLYRSDADIITDALQKHFKIPFIEDLINHSKVMIVDVDGKEKDIFGDSLAFFSYGYQPGIIYLPVRFDKEAGIYYTVGLGTAIHEAVHFFDYLVGNKYSLKERVRTVTYNFIKKTIRKIQKKYPSVKISFLNNLSRVLYYDLEKEQKAEEIALDTFFSALTEAKLPIPNPEEFIDFLDELRKIDPHYTSSLLPKWYAYKKLEGTWREPLEEEDNDA